MNRIFKIKSVVFSKTVTAELCLFSRLYRTLSFRNGLRIGDDRGSNVKEKISTSTQYADCLSLIKEGRSDKSIARYKKQGKLLAEERLQLLLDKDTDFLELSPFAGILTDYGCIAKAGIITGIGKINDTYCVLTVGDGTIKGGTIFPITLKKQLRAQEISKQLGLPMIYVVDTGGAFLPMQDEIFLPGGKMFFNEAVLSSLGIPQLAIVCGHCTAGGAYVPTMAQEAVIVDKIGAIFLGGPPLVKAALGEEISVEKLGGAYVHTSVSGCADHFAANEQEAMQIGRDIVSTFNISQFSNPATHEPAESPLYGTEILANDLSCLEDLDMLKVIAIIADGSRFHDFKMTFGPTIIAGYCRIHSHLVGLLANQGALTLQSAQKACHFVQMCSERDIPLVFLQNTSSTEDLGGEILKAAAGLLAAVCCTHIPKITITIGNAVGPASYLMGGRSSNSTFVFSWPTATYCIDLPKKVKQELQSSSSSFDRKMSDIFLEKTTAAYASSQIIDDGMIQPQDTRKVLAHCLNIIASTRRTRTKPSPKMMRI